MRELEHLRASLAAERARTVTLEAEIDDENYFQRQLRTAQRLNALLASTHAPRRATDAPDKDFLQLRSS